MMALRFGANFLVYFVRKGDCKLGGYIHGPLASYAEPRLHLTAHMLTLNFG